MVEWQPMSSSNVCAYNAGQVACRSDAVQACQEGVNGLKNEWHVLRFVHKRVHVLQEDPGLSDLGSSSEDERITTGGGIIFC